MRDKISELGPAAKNISDIATFTQIQFAVIFASLQEYIQHLTPDEGVFRPPKYVVCFFQQMLLSFSFWILILGTPVRVSLSAKSSAIVPWKLVGHHTISTKLIISIPDTSQIPIIESYV